MDHISGLDTLDYVRDREICDVKYNSKYNSNVKDSDLLDLLDLIEISFNHSDKKLMLLAERDCCSVSWFEPLNDIDFKTIVGKRIKNIITSEKFVPASSGRQEYDVAQKITIIFDNSSDFNFALINSSNGYYSGWLSLYLSDS